MKDKSHRVLILVAIIGLIGTLAAALIGNWDKIVSRAPSQKIDSGNPPAQTPEPSPTSHINISGRWRDPTYGTMSEITQSGDTFTYTAQGTDCQGRPFQSHGSGTIKGNYVESHYQSTYSEGRCEGPVSPDGMRMTGTCVDSACGRFSSSAVRQ